MNNKIKNIIIERYKEELKTEDQAKVISSIPIKKEWEEGIIESVQTMEECIRLEKKAKSLERKSRIIKDEIWAKIRREFNEAHLRYNPIKNVIESIEKIEE